MKSVNIGWVLVRTIEENEGRSIQVRVDGSTPDPDFEFQHEERVLNLSSGELADVLKAGAALNGLLENDPQEVGTFTASTHNGNRVDALTSADIIRTAQSFHWAKKMPKWTVIVNGRELPLRPLVTQAAGVPPNYPTNSHRSANKLKTMGFEVRYEGRSI